MGSTNSIQCDECSARYGEDAILEISHPGRLGGYNMCLECYCKNGLQYKFYPKKKCKTYKCQICKYKNKFDPYGLAVFKVHWYGKLGGKTLCESCLFQQKYKK